MFSSWNTCNIKVCPLVSVEMESWPLCLGKPSNIQTIKLPHTRVTEASARVALQIVLAERSLCKLKATEIGGLFYHWQILRLWLDAVSYLCYVLTSNPHTFPLHTYIYFIHTFFSSNTLNEHLRYVRPFWAMIYNNNNKKRYIPHFQRT